MRYLFFDIECCNGRNICEFGYVITNELFDVLDKQNFTINPEARFNLAGRSNQRNLKLFYPEQKYRNSPKFNVFYERIRNLLTHEDQIIVGHSIVNDAGFLRTAWKRYKYEPINFKFYDSQKMFGEYFNIHRLIALEEAGKKFNTPKPKYMHKSDEDSLATMQLVQGMCQSLDVSLPDLIELCVTCSGKIENNEISFDNNARKAARLLTAVNTDKTNMIRKSNYSLFFQFLDGVTPQGEIIKSKLNGKSICISINYESYHFREMLALIQLIVNHGGTYKLKASQNDYFVTCDIKNQDGIEKFCTRLKYVNESISQGKTITIITFEELLKLLNVEEKNLLQFPLPDEKSFLKRRNN